MWFFTAGRIQSQESNRTLLQTNILYPYTDESQRYEGKVTYSATAKHRFQGDYLKIIQTQKNYTFNPAISMDLRSLGDRKLPETLATLNYNGVLCDNFYVEGRYSGRRFSFVDAGAKSTDLIQGTLLIDQANGGRYWSDTFCGVCGDELRNNDDYYFKGSYFLSKKGSGSHNVSFGYDTFNDITNANNHQSGSDYRILGTLGIRPADRATSCRSSWATTRRSFSTTRLPTLQPGLELPDALGVLSATRGASTAT